MATKVLPRMTAARQTVAMARPPRRSRNVRVEDELWEDAQAVADERREVLSEEIRRMLKEYVAAHREKGKS